MNTELAKTFNPKTKEGETDHRYAPDLANIFSSIRPEVLRGLEEFKNKTTELEIKYGSYALEFCVSWFDYTDNLSTNHPDNKWNQKAKGLRKGLIEGLKERGFKSSNVSKIIGAAEFIKKLKDDLLIPDFHNPNELEESKRTRKILDFVNPLPISAKYLLGGMTELGLKKAMSYENDSKEWDSQTDTFPSKPLTIRVLEDLKQQYPLNPNEKRGGGKNQLSKLEEVEDNQETISIEATELKELTQDEIANNIVSLAKKLNTSEIWRDKQIVEILKGAEKELIALGHMVLTPSDKVLTSN